MQFSTATRPMRHKTPVVLFRLWRTIRRRRPTQSLPSHGCAWLTVLTKNQMRTSFASAQKLVMATNNVVLPEVHLYLTQSVVAKNHNCAQQSRHWG
ncbi:hypothetical protein ACN47E_008188 [Coniothyrium glycines]